MFLQIFTCFYKFNFISLHLNFPYYYCSIDLKKQSEHSGLLPDTSSLVSHLSFISLFFATRIGVQKSTLTNENLKKLKIKSSISAVEIVGSKLAILIFSSYYCSIDLIMRAKSFLCDSNITFLDNFVDQQICFYCFSVNLIFQFQSLFRPLKVGGNFVFC